MFGILCLNKPAGSTSRDIVNQVQRLIRPIKIGHSGTLDPMATGVLLLPIGRAVRLVEYMHDMPKSYVGDFQLGVTNDSADAELPVIAIENAAEVTASAVENVLGQFRGSILQRPPMYSAIKIEGRRAYDRVRAGERPEMPERSVVIHELELIDCDKNRMRISTRCSSGTYIRSLGRDLARAVGSDAIMTALERTAIGEFRIEDAIELDSLRSVEDVQAALLPALLAISHFPTVTLTPEQIVRLGNGQKLDRSEINGPPTIDLLAAIDDTNELVSIIKPEAQIWRTVKNFISHT
jgi:tRNA pseudouridine55 synthase